MANINLREVALDTLFEIFEHQQFSHIYLKQVLDKYAYLEKSERAFITRLVNGTIERAYQLDYIIDHYSKTKVKKMKPLIRTIMRMGCFEIYFMDSVPDSATCNECVKLAKKRGFSGLSGFVNGVLRGIARDKGNLSFDAPDVKYSMPQWIIDKWTDEFGRDNALLIAENCLVNKATAIRTNTKKVSREELYSRLETQGIKVEIIDELDEGLFISGYDSVAAIPEFEEGLFYVQDYSSQKVAKLAGIKQADLVLDVCAAPGGKALHAALKARDGHVTARDLTDYKVELINENIQRAGAENITAEKWDATVFDEASAGKFDVVIADLPCSGLGIIAKKPDIKYSQSPEQLTELVKLQGQILDTACQYVKAGGTLCYSTCTINRDENAGQVECFLKKHSDFMLVSEEQMFVTEKHDGFYIAVLTKA